MLDNFKPAMSESTSIFLLVGAIFLISSIALDVSEINFIVLTLFLYWSIANHFLAIFSKTESIRPYARGGLWSFLLYVIISLTLFVGFAAVSVYLLLMNDLDSFKDFLLESPFPKIFTGFWIILIIIWLIIILYKKSKAEKESGKLSKEGTYQVECFCKNCNSSQKLNVPIGIPFTDYPCPNCKILALYRKKDEGANGKESLAPSHTEESTELRCYRNNVFVWYLLWIVILLVPTVIFLYCRDLFGFWFAQSANLLFCLAATFWGTAYRAKWVGRDSKSKSVNDLKSAYRFKYPFLNIAIASLVFAYLTSQQLKFDWLFYFYAFPYSFFLSVIGYGLFAKIDELLGKIK